jgi:two-component system, chemotaxis family, chemotaxis protein CheY
VSTVLVVDDRYEIRATIQELLERSGYDVLLARNGQEAIEQYRCNRPDVVLLDMFMPVMNGFDALFLLRQEFPDAKVIAVSGGGSNMGSDALEEARNLGAQMTLLKPIVRDQLLAAISELLPTV